ncbi:MAG: hypothetical protein ACRD0S_03375 [Acidimicrobiales bacterium]
MEPGQWQQLTELAAHQHALVGVPQIRAAGISKRTQERAVANGLLSPYRRSVLAVAGAPASVWQPLMGAWLAADRDDIVVSHRGAGGLHRLPGILPGAVELTARSGPPLRLSGARCHSTTELDCSDTTRIGPFAATTPARTILDLAGQELDRSLLSKIVAHACRLRLCAERDLDELLARLAGPGRGGVKELRTILADRSGGDSGLEDRWLRLLTAAGLRPPSLQYQLVVDGRVLVLDFAWPAARVGIEVDGWAVHRERHVWDRDHDKINAYLEAGWRVLFVTSRTVPAGVFRQLRCLLSSR